MTLVSFEVFGFFGDLRAFLSVGSCSALRLWPMVDISFTKQKSCVGWSSVLKHASTYLFFVSTC